MNRGGVGQTNTESTGSNTNNMPLSSNSSRRNVIAGQGNGQNSGGSVAGTASIGIDQALNGYGMSNTNVGSMGSLPSSANNKRKISIG